MAQLTAPKESASFRALDRPEVALITNHGYGGAQIPIGGAPDTGGQNNYVNTLARKLDALGYKVTIFARGGFPQFEEDRMRRGVEYLTERVRYVFVPGGGAQFLRKEDIAVALDEQLEWMVAFCRQEAAEHGCRPWQLYEFVNSHYWDAGVLGVGLVERWRSQVAAESLQRVLHGVVDESILDELQQDLRWRALGEVADFYLGRVLFHHVQLRSHPIELQLRAAASLWSSARALDAETENRLVDRVMAQIAGMDIHMDPQYERLVAAGALGREILASIPEVDEQLKRELAGVDRHVWTPHSLGELKDFNYRDREEELRRSLKFCERRSHERMICRRSHAFAATSAKIAERLWTHYHVPMEDTFYFPPCVDRSVFRAYLPEESAPAYDWLVDATGIPRQDLERATLVFETSRMDRTKRKDLLLAGFARLTERHPDSYLLIGGGPDNETRQALEHQLEMTPALHGRAFLLGAIPEEHIGPMFSIADIYATASEMEGFGMSVSQAAAAGRPIVSTDSIPFSAHHAAKDALLFGPGDVDAFAKALSQLLGDAQERERRGSALAGLLGELDWQQRTDAFLVYLSRRGFDIQPGKVGA